MLLYNFMIEITPAILETNISTFRADFAKFKDFRSIDIDICFPPFTSLSTVKLEDLVNDLDTFTSTSLGIHLMVAHPEVELEKLKPKFVQHELRIYLHQESNLKFLRTFTWPKKWLRGVSLKAASNLNEVSFYDAFDEVQLMTVEIGKQGNSFIPEVLEKCSVLRELGYKKLISIDGGVNLKTAPVINNYALDRVSVGSYFVQSDNVELAKMKLELALNMKGPSWKRVE